MLLTFKLQFAFSYIYMLQVGWLHAQCCSFQLMSQLHALLSLQPKYYMELRINMKSLEEIFKYMTMFTIGILVKKD